MEVRAALAAAVELVQEAEVEDEPEAGLRAARVVVELAEPAGLLAEVKVGLLAEVKVELPAEEPVAVRAAATLAETLAAEIPAGEVAWGAAWPAAPIFRASPTETIPTTNRGRLFRYFRRVLRPINRFFICWRKAPAASSSSIRTIC